MGDIRLFVSHAHEDHEIAAALVKVIEAAMVPRERILCTSHPDRKYRYPDDMARVDVIRYLREHLTQSSCVLGLLTPKSINRPWCMIELGGAWAMATRTYCVLAGGLSPENLPDPLNGLDAAQLTEPEEIRKVMANLRQALVWDERVKGSATKEIDDLVNVVRRYSWDMP